ncbi:hypothetical protein [Merdimmobilis hominis]|nr:hypothetical protein [Merdimmobilis hominis]
MIRQEILKELLPFTAEELEFLDGRKTINRDLYMRPMAWIQSRY